MANSSTAPNSPADVVLVRVADLQVGDEVWLPAGYLTVTATDGFGPLTIVDFLDRTATPPIPYDTVCHRRHPSGNGRPRGG